MKQSILLLSAMFVCLAAIARKPGYADYKPLSAFSGDTVAYLNYNWGGSGYGDKCQCPFAAVF